jgi:hypothetical protein
MTPGSGEPVPQVNELVPTPEQVAGGQLGSGELKLPVVSANAMAESKRAKTRILFMGLSLKKAFGEVERTEGEACK